MKIADLFLEELERESAGTRRVLERVPEGRNDWKPHEKSMALGYLAGLVASMPGWIPMMVNKGSMDIASPEGAKYKPQAWATGKDLVRLLDQSLAEARAALKDATDEHLMKPWKFVVGGHVVSEMPRYVMIRDSVLNHMAHHRGQLTVYLRLCGAPVPAIYGPSADEGGF
ncbi:MAG: DinB family protein [Terriglobia bacterium]